MASFVTEVLAHSGKLEKEDLSTKLSKLCTRVEKIKGEVSEFITNKYDEFLPSMQSTEDLVFQVDGLSTDVDQLKSRIENEVSRDLHVAITEYADLKEQLEKNTVILSVLKQLQKFDSAIEEYNCAFMGKNYIAAARHLEEAQACLQQLKARKGCELKLLDALRIQLIVQTNKLICHLGEEWQQLVTWKVPPGKELITLESLVKTELHLSALMSETEEEEDGKGLHLGSVLQAFAILGELNTKLKSFSHLLMEHFLKPLVRYPSLHVQTVVQSKETVLQLSCTETEVEHAAPQDVFIKLLMVLELLHKHLLDVPLEEPTKTVQEKVVLSQVLGNMIWEDLSECIIKDCLVYSIPTDSSKLEEYEEVIKTTEMFEKALKDMRFLKGDSTNLLKYAQNVNVLFASKKCQDVIVAARNLMTSEIHTTVKIAPESKVSVQKLPNPGSGDRRKTQQVSRAIQESVNLETQNKLGQHTFSLPACRISESVQKLVNLAYSTMTEATSSGNQCAIQLFYTVRHIFHLFHDVVPTYHKENLQKLPQLTAIHHNNCMYIAHHLLTLGHQFRYHLPSPLCEGAATFVDLVPGLRRLGTESFLAQMRLQKEELLGRLSSAKNFANIDVEENDIAANKALRQIIHHLKRLGSVWQDVLPVHIYCKAMGTLLNSVITEMISKITALEDISAESGDKLHTLCKTMVEEGPLIFTPLAEDNQNKRYQEEVPVFVPKWMKFKELLIVLQASLQEIVDRWTDGHGPLAVEFSPVEIKSLIRALFQNTGRRAAALSKII
ncbi:centromere/kinetochore protein zw10 homolog isoform X1 [Lissotriton helveticus]